VKIATNEHFLLRKSCLQHIEVENPEGISNHAARNRDVDGRWISQPNLPFIRLKTILLHESRASLQIHNLSA
jgi:hypothetical protein